MEVHQLLSIAVASLNICAGVYNSANLAQKNIDGFEKLLSIMLAWVNFFVAGIILFTQLK